MITLQCEDCLNVDTAKKSKNRFPLVKKYLSKMDYKLTTFVIQFLTFVRWDKISKMALLCSKVSAIFGQPLISSSLKIRNRINREVPLKESLLLWLDFIVQ